MVHRHPDHAPLWLSLALLLLNMHPHAPVKASAPCAGAALVLGRGSMDISKASAMFKIPNQFLRLNIMFCQDLKLFAFF